MRPVAALLAALALAVPAARAAVAPDPVLAEGLHALETQTNGVQAACLIWYQDRPRLASEMEAKVDALCKDLGAVVGSEVVATQHLASRDDRTYVVVYFERHPLWFLFERYVGREGGKDKPGFLPLKVSLQADDILPSFITEFKT